MIKNYKDCLFIDKTLLKSQQRFKSHCHNIYTEQIDKIALSIKNDKILKIFDKTATYPYRETYSKYVKVSFEERININD